MISFDVKQLADKLRDDTRGVSFAFIHGSGKDGFIREDSDLDIGVYFDTEPTQESLMEIMRIVNSIVAGVNVDIGILSNNEPIYGFEVLKGKPLFINDMEKYLRFFSLTCREYETQIADYERQLNYRHDLKRKPNHTD